MTQSLYLQPNEVAPVPGRFQDLWSAIEEPAAADYIAEASRTIDDVTGQDGGLLLQTNKTLTRTIRESTDSIFLPNKPLQSVSALQVQRAGTVLTYQTTNAISIENGAQYFKFLPFGQASQAIPSGITAVTMAIDGQYWPFAENDLVTVTYSCGYAPVDLPYTIKDVCRRIIAESILSFIENAEGATEKRQNRNLSRWGTQDYVNTTDIRTRRALLPYSVNKIR